MRSSLTPELYAQIQHEFLALRDLKGVECDLRLAEVEQRLPEAFESIRRLMEADAESDDFLEVPLVDHKSEAALETTEIVAASAQSYNHPEYVGPFRILQQIGEGGHGLIFMAEQQAPIRRRVAIKWIKPGMDSSLVLARFEAERQALAMMSHPSIANVIDAGRTDTGQPYFVMELVHGIPIDRFCETNELGLRERLQVFCQVCDAVHHAHRKGIIHRDIKPSNVLVTVDSGTPLAKVIDFGIAKALHMPLTEKTMFTEYGQIMGTLEYMSPEQAMMSQSGIDVRSDVYSLGVMLYVLITGQTPLSKQQLLEDGVLELQKTLQEIQPQTPSLKITTNTTQQRWRDHSDSPEKWAKAVKGDLDWITMKTLAKQPSHRYDSAAEFAQDIQQFLSGDVVTARPPSRIYLFQKWFARHRVMATISGAVLGCILISTAALWWAFTKSQDNLLQAKAAQATVKAQSQQLGQSLQKSRRETARADLVAKKLSRLLQQQIIESAWSHAISGDFEAAVNRFAQIPEGEAITERKFVLSIAEQMQLPIVRPQDRGTIRRVAVHRKSGTLAVLNARAELELYYLNEPERNRTLTVPGQIYSACEFSHNGQQLLLAGSGMLTRVDLQTDLVQVSVRVARSSIRSLIHDPIHRQWVVTTGANFIRFIDEDTLQQSSAVDLGTRVAEICLTHNSSQALVAAMDGRLIIVPIDSPTEFILINRDRARITHFNAGADAVTLVDASGGVQTIPNEHIYQLCGRESRSVTAAQMEELAPGGFEIAPVPVSVAFSSGGVILTASGGKIQQQTSRTAIPIHRMSGKIKQVIAVAGADDLLVVLPSDQISMIPALLVRQRLAESRLLAEFVDAAPGTRGNVVAATASGELQVWSTTPVAMRQHRKLHDAALLEIDTHEGRNLVASVSADKRLVIAEDASLMPLHKIDVEWGVRCVRFSHNGALLAAAPDSGNAVGLREGTIDLWNTESGEAAIRLVGHQNWVLKAAFDAKDELLATLAVDETARVWSTLTGETTTVVQLAGLPRAISMAFRADGKQLVIGHEDGSLSFWDSTNGKLLKQHQLATDQILCLEFVDDGNRLLAVSKSQDGLIIADPQRLGGAIALSLGSSSIEQARIHRTSRSVGVVTSNGSLYFWQW